MPSGWPKGTIYVWMRVTADKYSLPILVADSGRQLAEMCGVKSNTIFHHISQHDSGRAKGYPKYIRVALSEEEADE